jgi:hypothetical protein
MLEELFGGKNKLDRDIFIEKFSQGNSSKFLLPHLMRYTILKILK